MRRPLLKDYDTSILLALSKQQNDATFNEEVRRIIFNRYKDDSYDSIYLMYCKSDGVKALALGDVLAKYLIKSNHFIDKYSLELLLHNISLDDLWNLATSNNDLVKDRAREVLLAKIDELSPPYTTKDNPVSLKYTKKMLKKKNRYKERMNKND